MSTLVKTESFHAFEQAYNKCFGTSYADEKKQELGRANVSRRILVTKKDFIETMNRKGIDNEMILSFVDSVRNCTPGAKEFITEYRCKNISTTEVVELINDLGLTRLRTMLKMATLKYRAKKHDADMFDKISLKRVILLVGIMADVRIESYSALSLHGAYDLWCKSDGIVCSAYAFFSEVCFDIENQIFEELKAKIVSDDPANPDNADNSKLERKAASVMNMLYCGRRSGAEYGLDEEKFNLYSLLKRIIALIDGQCEWYWSED